MTNKKWTSEEEPWILTEYGDDIYQHMRKKELERYHILEQSPQLAFRPDLVKWIKLVCEKLNLSTNTTHLSVYILDVFMDKHDIVDSTKLELVALGSIIVAAKSEEVDTNIPRNDEINRMMGNAYRLRDFMDMEIAILKALDWKVHVPLVPQFVDYFFLFTLTSDDLTALATQETKPFILRYIGAFLDIILTSGRFVNFLPSYLAAACIACTRLCLYILPFWSEKLAQISSINPDDKILLEYMTILMGEFCRHLPGKQSSPSAKRGVTRRAIEYDDGDHTSPKQSRQV